MNLLHLGIDGPRINTEFQKELQAYLHEKEEIAILPLGTCLLHLIHNVFKNGISEVSFPSETFFNDLRFLVKVSSAQRDKMDCWSWCCYMNSCWVCKEVWSYIVAVYETGTGVTHLWEICMWWKCILILLPVFMFFKLEFRLGYAYAKCKFRPSIYL